MGCTCAESGGHGPTDQQQPGGGQFCYTAHRTTIPTSPRELTLMLSASVQRVPGPTLVTNSRGRSVGPWIVDRAVGKVRQVDGLHFHCLRHHLASLLKAAVT